MRIIIINGPNLNLLGSREPEIYGNQRFEDYFKILQKEFNDISLAYFQSNHEGDLIDQLHKADKDGFDGVVLNAGGYSHTSVALADAVASIAIPVVGVHLSNIYKREQERHQELLAQYLKGGIYGLGIVGYKLAIASFVYQK